jgi:hypothetical protein
MPSADRASKRTELMIPALATTGVQPATMDISYKIDRQEPWILENSKGKMLAAWPFTTVLWYESEQALELALKFIASYRFPTSTFKLRCKRPGNRIYRTRYVIDVKQIPITKAEHERPDCP